MSWSDCPDEDLLEGMAHGSFMIGAMSELPQR
jgi:hypothetical protein